VDGIRLISRCCHDNSVEIVELFQNRDCGEEARVRA
jgi:hypothetical protein